jgi:hypothetical protein
MPFAGKWVELEIIILSEITQAQEAKYLIFANNNNNNNNRA